MSIEKYPCVLLINDIHISKDNIPEFIDNWNEALAICHQNRIEYIAVGGDLFQSRSSQTLDVLLAVQDALTTASANGVVVVLANGNHDKVNQEAIRGYCHVFQGYDNVLVVDDFTTLCESEEWQFALHLIAYFPENGSFVEKLNELRKSHLDTERKNFLYIHQGVNGALAQSNEKELSPSLFRDFDRVFVGHYHNRCVIPGTNVEFIGASRQHNFGEDEEKGYTILYSDGSYEFRKNRANIRYQVVDVPAEKMNVHLTDWLEELKEDGKYRVKVRVYAAAGGAPDVDKKGLLRAGAAKVEVVTENPDVIEVAASSLFEKFDLSTIRETYREFCRDKEIGDVDLGLSYLSKINNRCGN